MVFALILACTAFACFALRNPIKAWPLAFYAAAILVDVVFLAAPVLSMPRAIWTVFFLLIQKCTLPLALFIVVMYIGVFGHDSKVAQWLRPIRAELSIIAWLLSLGHMIVYMLTYVPRVTTGSTLNANIMASFVLAVVLLVLLIVLGVTSFNAVKKHMLTKTWKSLQRLAYPFFILTYVHLVLMLLPSALHGGEAAAVTVGVYTIVFGLYAGLRIRRALIDSKATEVESEAV